MAKREPKVELKAPPPVVRVAYEGILAQFKLYATAEGAAYVKLPNGKRAYVEPRRDGTYIVKG